MIEYVVVEQQYHHLHLIQLIPKPWPSEPTTKPLKPPPPTILITPLCTSIPTKPPETGHGGYFHCFIIYNINIIVNY